MAAGKKPPLAELLAYVPIDRRLALARGEQLPTRLTGTALVTDLSGFTPLAEALVRELGPRRGAEELTRVLNLVYEALIDPVHRYRGSVVSFSGDALTCWFDRDNEWRAVTAALAMQRAMERFGELQWGPQARARLAIRVSVVAGTARRFQVGDPRIQWLDVLAGALLERAAQGQQEAARGQVVVGPEVVAALRERLFVDVANNPGANSFVVLDHLAEPAPEDPWPALESPGGVAGVEMSKRVTEEEVGPWLLRPIYERLQEQQESFMAELRPAVAMFVRFGGLDYDQDEMAGEKLDRYVRWVQGVLAHYKGCLLQLTCGDKGSYWYAALGAPLAHDDDPARAVAAARQVLSPPPELGWVGPIQVGLSRGMARVGAYGSMLRRTYGVLGDEVNVAARLMMAAAPGQILVSQRLARAATRQHRFQALEPLQLKGKRTPLAVYAVSTDLPALSRRPVAPLEHPLVGREKELDRLEEVMERVLAGAGQVLRLQGESGIGKSHLVAELAERAGERGMRVAVGICQGVGLGAAYTPWRQVWQSLLEQIDHVAASPSLTATTGQGIVQLEAAVNSSHPDWLPRLPLLGDLLAWPIPDNEMTAALDPHLRRESLLALSVEMIRDWAGKQPLFLWIEDAHWMDEASIHLTSTLCRSIGRLPVLLALVHRPVGPDNPPLLPDLDRLPYYRPIELGELPPSGAKALVTELLQGEPSTLLLSLFDQLAQGHPLFVEELASMLGEAGGLVRDQDQNWTLADQLFGRLREANCLATEQSRWALAPRVDLADCLGLPDQVEGTILARVDRLEESPRLTLKVAGTIGRVFEYELLPPSHPDHLGREALLEQVELLQAHGFIRTQEPPPRLSYVFRSNVTQQVVYRTLLEEQRRQLHRAVGEALEQLLPTAVERLAYHYHYAGVREKALLYLDRAAHKAQREYANETALYYYDQALSLEERWEWFKGKVEVLHVLGRRDEEEAALKRLAQLPGAPPFEVAYLWGQYDEAIGAYAQARSWIEQARDTCREAGDLIGRVRCLAQLGLIARRQGEYDRARERYEEALVLLPGRETSAERERVLCGLGAVLRQQGSYDRAQECYEQVLRSSRQGGNRLAEAEALNDLGVMAFYRRDFVAAQSFHQQALEIWRAYGVRTGEGTSLYNLAMAARDSGEYGQAQKYLDEALAIHQATGNRWEEVNTWNELGILYLFLGLLREAHSCLQEALQLGREIGDEAAQAYVLGNLALVARDQGDLPSAERSLVEGLALAQKQNDKYLIALYWSYLGSTSRRVGRPAQAIEQARAALDLRRELGLQLWTTADLATLAAAYLATGNVAMALDYAVQALALLDECGGVGPEFPHHDYLVCSQVLEAAGESGRAAQALQSAYEQLMAQANRISDPSLRRSFLEQAPLNREIVQAYRRP